MGHATSMKQTVIVLSLGDKCLSGAIRNMDVTYIDESQMLLSDAALRSYIDLDRHSIWPWLKEEWYRRWNIFL